MFRVVGSAGGGHFVLPSFNDSAKFGDVKRGETARADSMGENCSSFTICIDYVGNGIHVDDGIDGLYQVFGETVLACQRGHAG